MGRTTFWVSTAPGTMRGVGLTDIVDQAPVGWSTTNEPWTVPAGANVRDNIPAGVPVYTASTFSSSADVATVLAAVEAAVSTPGYVYFGTSARVINTLQAIGTNAWYGYPNSSRKIMGFIGDGVGKTSITEGATMIPSAARSYALAPSDTSTPLPLYNFLFSNTGSTVPLFFAGISFDGRFQGPYGVAASSGLNQNTTTASPIPHRGLALNRAIAGSRIQYCRFRGFAYDVKASPPYELSGLESNYDAGLTISHVEIDGREVSVGGLSAGGYMNNYAATINVDNFWLHDTRRSGFAIHEHSGGDNGTYNFGNNVQVERIATTADSFQGSSLGFNAINLEEVTGRVNVNNSRMALDGGYHLTLGTSAGGTVAQSINVTNFTSLSSAYNGCLVIRIIKTPNSLGTSPYWNLFNTSGLAGLPFHVTNQGVTLTPIASGSFNASLHTPDKNFIVVTS